jgi:enterochelin esterase-like enzyme
VSLTGGVFLTLVGVLTGAAFVGLVVVWPSLAGRSAGRVAARAGMLVLVNGLVLLTAATQLNARFLFFADWTDLRGAISGSVIKTSLSRGGSAVRAAERPVGGTSATAVAVLPTLPPQSSHDPVLRFTVTGPLSGLTSTVVVRLPPGYTDPAQAATRYPVLETFQGYPGSPRQWVDTMRIGSVMGQAVAAHRMRAALVVSPQVEIPAGVDTECVNGAPGRPQLETWLAQDVPNWVARTFRVRTDRTSWATIGYSTGGWCAAMVAMLHPAQYGGAVVLGGYFRPQFGPSYEPYAPRSGLAERYDLVALTKRSPAPVALWLETSHSDAVSYATSSALLRVARSPLSLQAVVLRHAGHRVSLWQGLLPEALGWLGRSLGGFGPAA